MSLSIDPQKIYSETEISDTFGTPQDILTTNPLQIESSHLYNYPQHQLIVMNGIPVPYTAIQDLHFVNVAHAYLNANYRITVTTTLPHFPHIELFVGNSLERTDQICQYICQWTHCPPTGEQA